MEGNPKPRRPGAPAIIFLLFFAMFGVIGAGLLIHLWFSGDPIKQPPLIFRFVGSAIACMFMLIGFGVPISVVLRHLKGDSAQDTSMAPGSVASSPTSAPVPPAPPSPTSAAAYRCPHCGAGIGTGQEVSPSGDAKCIYCHRWWNIHRQP